MKSAEAFDVMPPDEHRDAIGRRRLSARRREELIGEFRAGRVSAAAFARKHGLCYTTLVSWLRRAGVMDYAKPRASSSSTMKTTEMTQPVAPAFRELRIETATTTPAATASCGMLTVSIPGGVEVRGCDAATAVALIKALRESR